MSILHVKTENATKSYPQITASPFVIKKGFLFDIISLYC
jgi:hypothetical protein